MLGIILALVVPVGATPLVSPPAKPLVVSPGAADDCSDPGVSADGRYVVFVSSAENLVVNDHNDATDVFVRDRQLGKTILVSVNAAGTGSGNGASHSPTISTNGQFVVFESAASDLVTNDNNNAADVFVRDLVAGTTTLVSQTPQGASGNLESTGPTLSPNGRYVLFVSRASNLVANDGNGSADLFVRDLVSGTTTLVTRNYANTSSAAVNSALWITPRQISDDGRWVAFESTAVNLITGDTNVRSDVFVRDLQAATSRAASINAAGTGLGNGHSLNVSMDATGRYVVFQSLSSNLATNDINVSLDVYRRDLVTGTTTLVSVNTNGTSSSLGVSGSAVLCRGGNVAVFMSTAPDLAAGISSPLGVGLFLRDFVTRTTRFIDAKVAVVSPTSGQGAATPAVSADGRFVLYEDAPKDLVLFDALNSTRVTVGTGLPASDGVMTDDAHYIAFLGQSDGIGGRNVYLYDRDLGVSELVSLHDPGLAPATGSAASRFNPGALSANGRFVVFESAAADLDAGDTNRNRDVWYCDLGSTNAAVRLGALIPDLARGPARRPVICGDGGRIAFEAIPDSTPVTGLATRYNLYVFDRVAQTNMLIGGVGSVASSALAAINQNGAFLAFQSSESGVGGYATTVGQVYYRDLAQPTNQLVSLNYLGTAPGAAASFTPAISPDSRYVAYLSSATTLVTNTTSGVNAYMWDATRGANILVSASPIGAGLNLISQVAFWAGGSLLSFQRGTTNYLYDVPSRSVVATLVDAVNISVSGDGRLVACERVGSYSAADTNGMTDVYVIDRTTGAATLASVGNDGQVIGNGKSLSPAITPDGRYVLFRSRASNLVANDSNSVGDVLVRDLLLNRTILASINRDGTGTGNRLSCNPLLSEDGSTVIFGTYASDLVANDHNAAHDLVVLRLSRGDMDGDGLPDDWELAYFNTLDRDGTGDFDQDGQTDRAEYLAGTDPTNRGSVFRAITLAAPSAGTVRVLWSAVPGKKYRVEYKGGINDLGWTELPGDVEATDPTGFKDDTTPGASDQRYYRVRLVP